ncbi:hypothetical protein VitviT2T_023544 [Vitis vinifera]|uniref:Subtilisin-like protease SBT4.14 n=2 Tax=Vitis vinifera TaxID=29760 RepID=A0ABY9DCZ2_VITVI|nr:subtilisin-like protease SBT4.14 [Vitis vinifera]RVX01120.1 Subtilisin-like protease SBT4.14 [Vitis vinifera]WKA05583.1 hypothetical protein VitviT2T_023544 [Vitis vinifera]|eukprot:XP_010661610.1 PREDICTED: subtilisin-like protease SBT4.14 [Vitis vinifera]
MSGSSPCIHSNLLLLVIFAGLTLINAEKKVYIVYFGGRPDDRQAAAQTQQDVLSKCDIVDTEESIVHSYTKSFNALAAKLSEDEAQKIAGMEEVVSVFPNRYHKLHTTKSWDFIGLPRTARRQLKQESNIIVGLLDTGITPQSESFADNGFGPPPAKWKGSCGRFANFSGCNNKLIGAKYFKLDGKPDPDDILSPVDVEGHGTHTASTVAGNIVKNANLFGLAKGTARGAVPSARVAMYKVCWVSTGCSDMDLLAGFEAAIADGVDVISISIGGFTFNYAEDIIAIGAFHAMKKGILTIASAGNDGPDESTIVNHAPWILTVGASGIDRSFRSKVVLGNGKTFLGSGLSAFDPKQKNYPLVSGADIPKTKADKENSRFCIEDSLDPTKVKGKLVYCELEEWGVESVVKGLGGIGAIVESTVFLDTPQIFMAPGTMINDTVGQAIDGYIHSTRTPSGVIQRTKEVKIPAPFVASFSSRGPNPVSQHILKPDVVAPGVDILASYTPLKSLTGLKGDTQFSKFTIMSGTSMACPHVSGVAAYVKSFHPKWSPAAIKSAITTTAKPMSRRVNKDGEFAYGAGQVNPLRALSPGLVYDMNETSYIQFLCHEGLSGKSIGAIVGSKSVNCSSLLPGHGNDALNYPTMQLSLKDKNETTVGVFRRTVTNVGPAQSVYKATIEAPQGVKITVTPTTLVFSPTVQARRFKVVVKAKPMASKKMVSGSLTWRSHRHIVRSPIVIYKP